MSISETEKQSLETDASLINGDALRELFESNEELNTGDASGRRCGTYDKIADPSLFFFLVAERGVGKTHILKLLRDRLLTRGDTVIPIELPENPIRINYEKLARQFPGQGITIWKLAILEEIAFTLLKNYLGYTNSLADRLVPTMIRRHLSVNGALFGYLQKYRPEEWNRLYSVLEKGGSNLGQALIHLIERIRIIINLQPVPSSSPVRVEVGADGGIVDRPPESQLEPKDRVDCLQEWIKMILLTMQSIQRPLPKDEQEKCFSYPLPDCACVYVIADQLDQWGEQSLQPEQIRDLVIAAYQLNDRFRVPPEQIDAKPGHRTEWKSNCKIIIAMRLVTYDYKITDLIKDMTFIDPKVQRIRWGDDALKRMLARRVSKGIPLHPGTDVDAFLSNKLLKKAAQEDGKKETREDGLIHYFGKTFNVIDFLLAHAGRRPRYILKLWKDCAKMAGNESEPFNTPLTEEQIIQGLKEYAVKTLPKELTDEYDAEYRGFALLMQFLAREREHSGRLIQYTELTNRIVEFQKDLRIDPLPAWLNTSPAKVIDVLYETGVIGIVREEPSNPDWRKVTYALDGQERTTEHSKELCFHPALWYHLTDIHLETRKRRLRMLHLYETLQRELREFRNQLGDIRIENLSHFEYRMGRFLVLGRLVLHQTDYAEPIDWKVWNPLCQKIITSWEMMGRSGIIGSINDKDLAYDRMDGLADSFEKIILASDSPGETGEVPFFTLEQIGQKQSNRDFVERISPVRQWVGDYSRGKRNAREKVDLLSQVLFGSNSLMAVVGRSIDNLKSLI